MSEWGKVKEALAQFVTEYENDRPVEDMGALQEEDFNVLYEASETDEPDIQAIRFAWESLTGLESRNHY